MTVRGWLVNILYIEIEYFFSLERERVRKEEITISRRHSQLALLIAANTYGKKNAGKRGTLHVMHIMAARRKFAAERRFVEKRRSMEWKKKKSSFIHSLG